MEKQGWKAIQPEGNRPSQEKHVAVTACKQLTCTSSSSTAGVLTETPNH
jgi:hypothetical protein